MSANRAAILHNLRGLKKREKRVMKQLIRRGHLKPEDFTMADGDETVSCPCYLNPKYARHGFVNGLKKGTPLVWQRVSYEYDEWDAFLPSEILEAVTFDWEGVAREMLAEGAEG